MKNDDLCNGVAEEPGSPITPNREAYWVSKESGYARIVTSSTDVVDDKDLRWVQARVTEFVIIQRTLMQRLLKTEIEGAIKHPSGVEVERKGMFRNGFLMTAATNANLMEEAAKRIEIDNANIVRISAQKMFVEKAVPTPIHSINKSAKLESPVDHECTMPRIELIFRTAIDKFPSIITEYSNYLSVADAHLISEIDIFRKDRVKWATLAPDGSMIAKESGKIGDAWIFIIPPGHSLIKAQSAMLSMDVDSSGLNPYLSILPYPISEKWACLGAVHELSHLRDNVLGIEPVKGRTRDQYLEGEHRAYSVEQAMAFAYSGGELQKALQKIVSNALKDGNPIDALNALLNHHIVAISQEMDTYIDPNPSLNAHEHALRCGLYVVLLGFEMARQIAQNDPHSQKSMEKKFIELIYEPSGHLPKK